MLLQHGVQVTIIEARDRIGGRVRLHHPAFASSTVNSQRLRLPPVVMSYH
jgi:monoamine oxidase